MTIVLKKFKRRLTFLCCTQNLENVLDSCKVADFCVFLTSVDGGEEQAMNPQADLLLTSLRNQGLPTSMGLIQNLDSLNAKQSAAMRKYATRLLQSELGVDVKVFDDQHVDQLLRALCDSVPAPLFWRQMRSYLLAEEVEVRDGGLAAAGSPVADLSVRGYLHGVPLSLYDRIHITGEGSHTIRCIRILPDPSPLKQSHGEAAVPQEWVPDQNRIHPIEEENPVDPNSVEAPHWAIPDVGENGAAATADNTEAIWREVVGDELYEDEEDRHAHEALMALDQEMALDDEMSEQEDFEVEDYEDFNRQNKQRNRVVMTGLLEGCVSRRGGAKGGRGGVLGIAGRDGSALRPARAVPLPEVPRAAELPQLPVGPEGESAGGVRVAVPVRRLRGAAADAERGAGGAEGGGVRLGARAGGRDADARPDDRAGELRGDRDRRRLARVDGEAADRTAGGVQRAAAARGETDRDARVDPAVVDVVPADGEVEGSASGAHGVPALPDPPALRGRGAQVR